MRTQTSKLIGLLVLLALETLHLQLSTAFAQGTAFTYQGRLDANGGPASGMYDLQFSLYNLGSGGTAVAGPVTTNGVLVTNGLFIVAIDFGSGVWNGATNWLEIGVETNGGGGFTALTPRQQLTPAPCSIFAENANAAGISGTIPAGAISGSYNNAIILNNAGNSFTGNGGGLTGVNAAMLNGLGAASFWQTTGNGGTTAGPNFIGTTDNQPLELRVNGLRALRLEPGPSLANGAPNVIGGSSVNFVASGLKGAVIGGGGAVNFDGNAYTNSVTGDFGTVCGGYGNTAGGFAVACGGVQNTADGQVAAVLGGAFNTAANYATIGGGFQNTASGQGAVIGGGGSDGTSYQGNQNAGNAAFIGGGLNNMINSGADYSAVVSGQANMAESAYSFVGGGSANTASAVDTTIAGGEFNTAGGDHAVVGGGQSNVASGSYGVVGGGNGNNTIGADDVLAGGYNNTSAGGNNSTISGGNGNNSSGSQAVIGGGQSNSVSAFYSAIGGGVNNMATNNSSVVCGGTNNLSGGYAATVPGGSDNLALGDYSLAAGRFAQATNNNTFVWSDGSTNTVSTTTNQFVARAANGFVFYSSIGGTGVSLAPGSGSWSTMSDRNAKHAFSPVHPQAILAEVASLPMTTWSYNTEQGVRHIGPIAQDFYAAFKVGEDNKHIAEVDEGGVALAAIQGLNQKLEEKDSEIETLKQQNETLEKRLDVLAQVVKSLTTTK